MQLFLDCDGVLADFNKLATERMGMGPREFEAQFGVKAFWNEIYAIEDFFFKLDPMADAFELVDAVRHLNPIILTGAPRGKQTHDQKRRWGQKWFPDLQMIICPSRDKIKYAKPGDVIVDDWYKYKQTWVDGGGVWVMHTSAKDSLRQLRELGVI